jgi:catechol 2,3-dioxygenase-like lactoylglutathione lyase family enzyme
MHLSLLAITVRDYDEAIAFYTQKLGFTLLEDTPLGLGPDGHPKRWVRVAPPGAGGAGGASAGPNTAALLLARAANPRQLASVGNQTGGRVFLFFETDNFQRDHDALLARGVVRVRPPKHESYGTVAVFEDLYGNQFDLIGPS